MNKKIFGLLAVFFALGAKAQVGRWLIKPNYDKICLVANQHHIKTDSAGIKNLWNLDGKLLKATDENLLPFVEGKAVVVGQNGKDLKGFYMDDSNATFIPLTNLKVANENDLEVNNFSNGLLRVYDGEYYRFIDANGNFIGSKYIEACDFANGFASCSSFLNMKKNKDPYLLLLDTDGIEVSLSDNGKTIKVEDIKYISQVNDEDKGIVVVDRKIYYFNGKNRTLLPLFATKDETNLKNQAKLMDDFNACRTINDENKTMSIHAKCGKDEGVTIVIDSLNYLVCVVSNTETTTYNKKRKKVQELTSSLKTNEKNGIYGICMKDGTEVLPPQFEEVSLLFDNKALVKKNGKWGMIEVMKDKNFELKINEGEVINFKHGSQDSSIELIVPSEIPLESVRLEIVNQEDGDRCEIKTNKAKKYDTSIEYPCALDFPDVLCDSIGEQGKEWRYLANVIYEDLTSKELEIKTKGKYLVYLDAMIEENTKVSKDSITMTVNVNTSNERLDYALDIQMTDPDTIYDIKQTNYFTETRREFTIKGLKEGENILYVEVTEEGCPTLETPFVITYIKPQKNKPVDQTNVKIKRGKRIIRKNNNVRKHNSSQNTNQKTKFPTVIIKN